MSATAQTYDEVSAAEVLDDPVQDSTPSANARPSMESGHSVGSRP